MQKNIRWTTILLLFLIMLCARINQQAAPVLMPIISENFMLSSTQVGLYATFWAMTSSVGAIILGRMSDFLGVRKILSVALLVYGVGIFLHGFSSSYAMILAGSFIAGLGFSAIFPSLTKYIRTQASVNNRAMIQGITMAGLDFGALSSALILPGLALKISWNYTFLIVALFPLVAAIPSYLYLTETRNTAEETQTIRNSFLVDLIETIKYRPFWHIAIPGFLMGGIVASILTHFSMYLYEVFLFSPVEAGWGFAFIFIGGSVGRLIAGIVSDRFFPYQRHIALGIFAGIAGATCLVFSFLTLFSNIGIPTLLIWLTAFIAGVGVFGENPIRFIMAGELVSGSNSGMIIGASLLVARIGFMLFPPLFGFLVDLTDSYVTGWILLATLSVGVIIRVLLWPKK